jgi:hypothetical protein
MSRLGLRCLIAMMYSVFSGTLLLAQSRSDDPSINVPQVSESAAANREDTPQVGEQRATEYVTALDGTGLISLDSNAPSLLLLGATVSGGWDSNPENLSAGVMSGLYTVNPYVGVQAVTPRVRALLQYQFTNTGFSSNYARQTMNVASASILGTTNERWSWDVKAMGSYGQDSVRFLGSQQTVAVGEVPGTGPNSASYLPGAGKVAYFDGGAGVKFRKTQRDTIELRAGNAFSHYAGLSKSSSIATVNLAYERDMSPSVGALAYVQNSLYYGSLQCESVGAGVGLQWKPGERTSVALSGGPQIDTAKCGSKQGVAFNASLSTRLTG